MFMRMTHTADALPSQRERPDWDQAEWPQPEPLSPGERMTLFGIVGSLVLLALGGLYLWIVRGEVLVVEGSFDVLCF
jgi:hypothetical protein